MVFVPSLESDLAKVWEQETGFRVQGKGYRVRGTGLRAQGSGYRAQGSELRVEGTGFSRPENGSGPPRAQKCSKSSNLDTFLGWF